MPRSTASYCVGAGPDPAAQEGPQVRLASFKRTTDRCRVGCQRTSIGGSRSLDKSGRRGSGRTSYAIGVDLALVCGRGAAIRGKKNKFAWFMEEEEEEITNRLRVRYHPRLAALLREHRSARRAGDVATIRALERRITTIRRALRAHEALTR